MTPPAGRKARVLEEHWLPSPSQHREASLQHIVILGSWVLAQTFLCLKSHPAGPSAIVHPHVRVVSLHSSILCTISLAPLLPETTTLTAEELTLSLLPLGLAVQQSKAVLPVS